MADNNPDSQALKEQIVNLKQQRNAVVLAHYYTRPEVQDIADFIGDSLALARIATSLDKPVVVMCGVHFMAETVKILCPEKTVLIPDPEAGCSLADSCPPEDFDVFIKANPGHTVLSYVNTSAAVKALTDIVVTSGNALKIVNALPQDEKIIFGPDRNLGGYINSVTGRKMLLWQGACHVHDRFSVEKLAALKNANPTAPVLAHPECRSEVLALADKVGSTAALLEYVSASEAMRFIVVTESGILHQMQKNCPDKEFITVPANDTACGCNNCEHMKLITLTKLYNCLKSLAPTVEVDPKIAQRAVLPIERMLAMS